MAEAEQQHEEPRRELKRARTILVKVGTEIVESADGLLAMGQIGALIEQVGRRLLYMKRAVGRCD